MTRGAFGVVLGTLVIAGCGGGSDQPEAVRSPSVAADVSEVPLPSKSPTPTPTAVTPTPELSQRGNIVKAIGETAWASDYPDGSNPWFEMQVTGIEVGAECTEDYAEPAENGQFMFVTIAVSTSSEWPAEMQGVPLEFNPNEFTIIGPDTLTEHDLGTAPTYGCLPQGELFPIAGFGPGENLTGTVVLDSANTTGVLVFQPWWAASGWEWAY
jgi:hypothetical protein